MCLHKKSQKNCRCLAGRREGKEKLGSCGQIFKGYNYVKEELHLFNILVSISWKLEKTEQWHKQKL